MNRAISKAYNDPKSPAYMAGVNAVYSEVRKKHPDITVEDVRTYLASQESYNLHKPVRKRFPRGRVLARGLDTDMQIDLVDLVKLKRQNNGHAFILCCIDVFSRFAWAEPLRDKRPGTVVEGFKKVLADGRVPWRVVSDAGGEFKAAFKQYLKDREIEGVLAQSSESKACVIERYIKTLKGRLWRYFSKHGTLRWIDILPSVVAAINSSKCRTTGYAPVDVTSANEHLVRSVIEDTTPTSVKFKFAVGDKVHITKFKDKLSKGYFPNWSSELFTITERLNRTPPVYKLTGEDNEPITGVFYAPELCRPAARNYKRR